jgi:hypothetical protein
MATSLSALTSLKSLNLDFRYPPPCLESRRLRGQRIFGGDLGPDRCPLTRLILYNLLQSNDIRHTTTLPVHQSKSNAKDTGKGPYPYRVSSQGHYYQTEGIWLRCTQGGNFVHNARVAAFIF